MMSLAQDLVLGCRRPWGERHPVLVLGAGLALFSICPVIDKSPGGYRD
jgi:hypothetical protein